LSTHVPISLCCTSTPSRLVARREKESVVVVGASRVVANSPAYLQVECIQGHQSERESTHESCKQDQSRSHEQEEPELFGSWLDVVSIAYEFDPQPHPSRTTCLDLLSKPPGRPSPPPRSRRQGRSTNSRPRSRGTRKRFRRGNGNAVDTNRWRIFPPGSGRPGGGLNRWKEKKVGWNQPYILPDGRTVIHLLPRKHMRAVEARSGKVQGTSCRATGDESKTKSAWCSHLNER